MDVAPPRTIPRRGVRGPARQGGGRAGLKGERLQSLMSSLEAVSREELTSRTVWSRTRSR
jgi:hypothetical protein